MKKIALYCRTAHIDEYAIEKQIKRLISFVNCSDYVIYIDNGKSGITLDRPAMSKLNTDIQNGLIKTIVTIDVSRIVRNCIIFNEWLDFLDGHGVSFISLS